MRRPRTLRAHMAMDFGSNPATFLMAVNGLK